MLLVPKVDGTRKVLFAPFSYRIRSDGAFFAFNIRSKIVIELEMVLENGCRISRITSLELATATDVNQSHAPICVSLSKQKAKPKVAVVSLTCTLNLTLHSYGAIRSIFSHQKDQEEDEYLARVNGQTAKAFTLPPRTYSA